VELDRSDRRSMNNKKAEALLTASTEYIGWFDSDCIVVGDITKYWIPANGSFQSRFRVPEEMEAMYRTKYKPGEAPGGIPERFQDIWRADVGENQTAAIKTTCTGDNF